MLERLSLDPENLEKKTPSLENGSGSFSLKARLFKV
jgi:hypothetical protein